MRHVVPGGDPADPRVLDEPSRLIGRPSLPGFCSGVARVEYEATVGREVGCDGCESSCLVVGGQEDLEGVAGQQHQVEASAQPDRSGVTEHPGDARALVALFRQGEHRRGGIDGDNEAIRSLGQRGCQHAGAAAKIEYCAAPFRQIACRSRNPRPSRSQCRKIEPHADRCNGRCRSFHRSHARRCRLVQSAGTPHQVIMAGDLDRNQGIAFPRRPRLRAAKRATYKGSKMTAGTGTPPYQAKHRATHKRKGIMPDETTFELASVEFGAEPVAVFRFGYERFELRARLGPGNLERAIAAAAEVAASAFCEMVARSAGLCAAGSRWRGRRASASLGRASRTSAHGARLARRRAPREGPLIEPTAATQPAAAATAFHALKRPTDGHAVHRNQSRPLLIASNATMFSCLFVLVCRKRSGNDR